jgi:hypothetical protein
MVANFFFFSSSFSPLSVQQLARAAAHCSESGVVSGAHYLCQSTVEFELVESEMCMKKNYGKKSRAGVLWGCQEAAGDVELEVNVQQIASHWGTDGAARL